ncbi:MAG: PaaI family thioesterase, partial [Aggregatilineales bacterium]
FLQQEFPQFNSTIEAAGNRTARVRYIVTEGDLRPSGTVSGPALFALADSALYVAILAEIGIVALAVTTNMTINFMRRPDPTKDVIAECRLIKVGKQLIVGDVMMYSDGDDAPIAHATGTYAIPPDSRKNL